METEGAVRRRLAVTLSAATLLLAGFFLWLKLVRGIGTIGPVPTFAFWILPSFAACWLAIWPQRRTARRQVRILAVATAVALMAVAALSLLHGSMPR